MNSAAISQMTSHLLAIALFVQGLEYFLLSRKKSFLEIFSYQNLKHDLEPGLPLPNSVIRFLFSDGMMKSIGLVEVLLSIAAFIYPHLWIFLVLFFVHFLICVRFRGTFNGGSDMMTFVLLTGTLIVFFAESEKTQRLGFIYIAINAIYSYFKAGFAKLKVSDWRRGSALPAFLNRSLYFDIRNCASWLQKRPTISFVFCWLVILFEIGIPAIFIFPKLLFFYFVSACLFHTIVFSSFGLNRFFWIWLAAWPSIFFSVGLI